ncbi:sigma E protease regulator RseP [Alteromonas sp. KUL49]|uniref:sigma E protease regulator RseP n=1 Tax=Alteromonas sp. KUL49 TaxID=2480798 RepID=UPI00102F20E2|nr:sigma E protease regulator RseP [Alteromonas sp. KUL49]TAP39626.1 sigma E protease regulator RseP [Alteromonas sp. KUL49]GEA11605.1 zinc metalloprotease [Alteromonas sp. KUL49]
MLGFLWSAGAFIVALGILVAVHEWGHFYVARRCGVHVERFSIGFGKPLWRRKSTSGTEYVIAAIPLGGYVRMLDGRVDDVPEHMAHKAFNNKTVLQRMAIIAAGPGVNFIFAFFALWIMYLVGLQTVKPVVNTIEPNSIAELAGVTKGDEIIAVGERSTPDWEAVNMELVSHIGKEAALVTLVNKDKVQKELTFTLTGWNFDPDKESPLSSLGITPFRPAPTLEVGFVGDDSAAERAGIKTGDVLVSINGEQVSNWQFLVDKIVDSPGAILSLGIERDGQLITVNPTVAKQDTPEGQRGYLGVSPVFEPWPKGYVFTHQYGIVESVVRAFDKTWRLITLSVEMIGKLLTGDVSVKNLSGPISIAQGAGVSAGFGLAYFLSFLALISVNLGIINLLPLPMLDGGHLLFYAIEWIRGKPVPDEVQEWGYRIGGMLLFTIMSIAIVNDIARIT